MENYAIIKNGIIQNTIVWDGLSNYTPQGLPINISNINPVPGIGWGYDGTNFANPNPPIISQDNISGLAT